MGILPALVEVATSGASSVLEEAVAVEVAVALDPTQRGVDVRAEHLELGSAAVPRPGRRGAQHVQRRRVVATVVGSVRNEPERSKLATS